MSTPIAHLVDDDDAVCDSITLLLQTARIGAKAYQSAAAFLADYNPAMEGCILLDIRMPGVSGPELQLELIRRGSILPIIYLSAYGDIPTTVRAIRNGAIDVLTKPVNPTTLLENVRAAFELYAQRASEGKAVAEAQRKLALLTQREKEILALIINGESSKMVARKLDISFRTVEVHRTHIMQKMDVDSLLALTALADACGLPTGRVMTPRHTPRPR
jgi:two-component system, LuxR family, response regulator FixJ